MKNALIAFILIVSGSSVALPLKCKCTNGSMTVEVTASGKITLTCSNGGQVQCLY